MSVKDNQELIKKLEGRKAQVQQSEKKDLVAQETRRCRAMSLTALGQETLKDGAHKGKTCKEVYNKQANYVIWLLQHQPENVKYLNVQIYAHRVDEESTVPDPAAAPVVSPPTKVSSGNMPMPSEIESEWDEISQAPPMDKSAEEQSQMVDMMKTMMSAFSDLKIQMDTLTQANDQHQAALHQSFGAITQIQQNQERQAHQLNELETKVNQS